MRFRVILEIDGPEPGTPLSPGSKVKLSPPEQWIWQDILNQGSGDFDTKVLNVRIIKAGICGNCENPIAFADYLCEGCRADSIDGSTDYDNRVDLPWT